MESAVISRLRATSASLQPLSRLRRQLPLHRGADLYPGSLPCVRGGGAQPRWGCGVCGHIPFTGSTSKFPTPQSASLPAPLTQGSRSLPREPPLCKGRWGAAPEGLWSLRDIPFTGSSGKFTIPQSPTAPAPFTQGSRSLPRQGDSIMFRSPANCRHPPHTQSPYFLIYAWISSKIGISASPCSVRLYSTRGGTSP